MTIPLLKKKWRVIALLILLTIPLHLISQRYYFKYYGSKDGLVGLGIENFYQDDRGYIWIATHSGISKFDGINFTNITVNDGLPNRRYLCITQDNYGNMWFGTTNGLVRYDGVGFKIYYPYEDNRKNFIRELLTDREGNLWLATSGGPCKLELSINTDIDTFQTFKLTNNPRLNVANGVMSDNEGQIWFALKSGIFRVEGNELKLMLEEDGFYLRQDNNNNIWIAKWRKDKFSLIKWDGEKITTYGHITQSPCINLLVDKQGFLWVTTWENGIFKFDVNGEEEGYIDYVHYSTQEGLPVKSFWPILEDKEGNIWMGAFSKGVCLYSGNMFTTLDESLGLVNNFINDMEFDNRGYAWLATPEGISIIEDSLSFYKKGTKITNITEYKGKIPIYKEDFLSQHYPNGRLNNLKKGKINPFNIRSTEWIIRMQNGNMCAATYNTNLIVWKNGQAFVFPVGGHVVVEDSNQVLWIGSGGNGIHRFNGKNIKTFKTPGGRNPNRVFTLYVDKSNNIWAGLYTNGINVIKNDSLHHFDVGNRFTLTQTGPFIQTPDSILWFGSKRIGIFGGKLVNDDFILKDSLSINNGLSNNVINTLYYTNDGYLWIGTFNGFNRLDYKEYMRSGEKIFSYYDINDGLPSNEITSINETPDGNLWIGTDEGISYFNRQADIIDTLPPSLNITNFNLFYGKEKWNDYADSVNMQTGLPVNLTLPYNKNHITISFQGIYFKNPTKVRYQWKLDGFDDEWSDMSSQNTVTYSNLPARDYTFLVKAMNDSNTSVNDTASIRFRIAPPFWQTLWFYALCIILVFGSFYSYLKYRTLQLQRSNRLLEAKVTKRTAMLRLAYDEIAEKNKDILDSINYAKRIQEAILPPINQVKNYLSNSFILYQPKDIVAGDFYWLQTVNANNPTTTKQNITVFFAVADCTGHGVPGALVSVVCHNALNRSLKEYGITEPAKILDKTSELVEEAFEGSEHDVKDGMDIALCSLTLNGKLTQMQFAGANNSLYIVSNLSSSVAKQLKTPALLQDNTNMGLFEIKGDKQPIGKHATRTPFTNHSIQLQDEDLLYLFSDGYADQFGGPKGKKFKYKPFKELLLSIHNAPMEEQCEMLSSKIKAWMGNISQVDDICIIGVKI